MNKKILLTLAALFFVIDCALVTYKLAQKEHKSKPIHKTKNNYKYSVYLTSDDGPLAGSKYLNELVLDYQFPLTLFLVGRPLSQDKNLKPLFKAYKNNPYLMIGNHSFTHANFHYKKFYSNPQGVEKDFMKNEKYLQINSKIARLPGRNVWVIGDYIKGEKDAIPSAELIANNDGYKFFGWDFELHFKRNGETTRTALENYKKIKEILKKGETVAKNQIVVLMHDQMFTKQKSRKMLGELVLLLQNDDECKLKLLKDFKMQASPLTIKRSKKEIMHASE